MFAHCCVFALCAMRAMRNAMRVNVEVNEIKVLTSVIPKGLNVALIQQLLGSAVGNIVEIILVIRGRIVLL